MNEISTHIREIFTMESTSATKASDSSFNIYLVSVAVTVIVLIISVVYSVRNLLRLWRAGKPKPVVKEKDEAQEDEVNERMVKNADTNFQQRTAGGGAATDIDPMEYCEHIQSEVKKAKQRVTMKKFHNELTEEQMEEESEIKKKQLEAIFKLMETQSDKFGVNSLDEIQSQMKLYG